MWQESVGGQIVLPTFDQQLWEGGEASGAQGMANRSPGATGEPKKPRR
jgi:hypothetical protein